MTRGHMKAQAQQKNQKKQEELRKSVGYDQKTACLKALKHQCTICKAMMLNQKSYKEHFQSKHPKNELPTELIDVAA